MSLIPHSTKCKYCNATSGTTVCSIEIYSDEQKSHLGQCLDRIPSRGCVTVVL